MHVESLSIFQLDLRQQIVSHVAGDELYEQVKDKLQQQSLEKRYKGYKLEEDVILTYKGRIYIPNVAELRRVVMDEIIELCILVIQDTRRRLLPPGNSTLARNEKGHG